MPRKNRIQFEGAWYHVFNRGISKKTIVFSEFHKHLFLSLLEEMTTLFGIEVHSYCLMRNHYHLLIHTPRGNLSKAMHFFGSRFCRQINLDLNADGSVFRDRFKSILVDSDRYLLQLSRYIHLNPVEAGLVALPEDYLLSSFSAFIGLLETPLFLKTEVVLSYFKGVEDYERYVQMGVDRELSGFYSKKRVGSVLGSDEFKRRFF